MRACSMPASHSHRRLRKCCRRRRGPNPCATAHSPQVRAAYIDKVSAKVLDLFRNYWAVIDRLEVGRCVGIHARCIYPGVGGCRRPSRRTPLLPHPPARPSVHPAPPCDLPSPHPQPSQASLPSHSTSQPPQEKVLTEADTLGAAEASSSGGVLSFFQRPAPAPAAAASAGGRADAFSLQDRALVLSHVEGPPLVLHAAEARGARFPYEVLFRSVNKLLMDTAAHEYLFCAEFWGDAGVYAALFAPVLAFVESSLAAALAELHDPIALLLMVRLNRECGLAMARRRNPALDGFYDRINLLLWPRLKVLGLSGRGGVGRGVGVGQGGWRMWDGQGPILGGRAGDLGVGMCWNSWVTGDWRCQ